MAGGILSSRILGLVRDQIVAYFFGIGRHADVFRAVFKGPNILQNLLGEQALSAAFIPIYSKMLAEGREREAGRFAGAIFGLLMATAALVALIGVLFAEPIVVLLSPGFLRDAALVAAGEAEIDRFPLAVAAVRILFPMSAVLVLSAWALGVLNSHRRFFISYFAPVLWNAAIITALLAAGQALLPGGLSGAAASLPGTRNQLVIAACWGALVGGALQFAFQLPLVARLMRGFRLSLSTRVVGVGRALRRFGPLLAARGAAQLSAYLDQVLSSLLVAGALGALAQAQLLYLLPISLFSMSVAAAELPELSELSGAGASRRAMGRIDSALRTIAFWVVPTAVGYLAVGQLVVGALFRRGAFGLAANWLVWSILAVYALGLLASSWSRLLGNVFFAAGETRKPATIAITRLALSGSLGALLMLFFDRLTVSGLAGVDSPLRFGAVGLALAAGLSAWVELALLVRALGRRGTPLLLPLGFAARQAALALAAAIPAIGVWWLLRGGRVELAGAAVLIGYAVAYFGLALAAGSPEAQGAVRTVQRVIQGSRPRGGGES